MAAPRSRNLDAVGTNVDVLVYVCGRSNTIVHHSIPACDVTCDVTKKYESGRGRTYMDKLSTNVH